MLDLLAAESRARKERGTRHSQGSSGWEGMEKEPEVLTQNPSF